MRKAQTKLRHLQNLLNATLCDNAFNENNSQLAIHRHVVNHQQTISTTDSGAQAIACGNKHMDIRKIALRGWLLLCCFTAHAASEVTIAQRFSHQSKILNTTLSYQVYLPESYHSDKKAHFPVVYLLDGEAHFTHAVGMLESLHSGMWPQVPEMIVVGVSNENRMANYTPTKATQLPNGESAPAPYKQTGQGPDFLRYLENELVPVIDDVFRTQAPNILVGHSFGGIMALSALAQTHRFSGLVALDPSLWYDYPRLNDQLIASLSQPVTRPVALFVAAADMPITPSLGRSTVHRDYIVAFNDRLNAHKTDNTELAIESQGVFYPGTNHHDIYHWGFYDAMKWLFDGYRINFGYQTINAEAVIADYAAMNKRLGANLKPSLPYLKRAVAKLSRDKALNENPDEVRKLIHHFYSK
ncbi:alpha/beta hydrolase [Thaumasiovibrio subtropicus]|uniref:alpha/beta hydrolase n=1 Tax=Thaumasiovibrio subtropicus TaxID=1891207 RepID=UPI00131E1920|nr:alpha/beta hydrolase-fold protein [Thaumasiovibrio subtropicus]